MGILFLTNLSPEIKKSDKLFFDQYRYCIKLQLPESSALRSFDHETIDFILDLRQNPLVSSAFLKASNKGRRIIAAKVREDLHKVCDFFSVILDSVKITFHSNVFFYVYTNQSNLAEEIIKNQVPVSLLNVTERQINRPKNTVRLRKTDKKTRIFFKTMGLSESEKNNLVRFFDNNQEYLRTSFSFDEFLKNPHYRYLQSNYFFDTADDRLIEMVDLLVPGILRKRQPIISDK